ncbi:MAG: amino acid permease [Spirochaetales bacterium]|nr:amino acid permease [Spirochaetales bacterium]
MNQNEGTPVPRRYGFWTASAMVVGITIGSGVFFKADDVLSAAGGSLPMALLAWLIGGAIMVVTAYVFARIASRIEKVNGMVDYFEAAYGEKAAYLVAWFMTIIYYPSLVAVLSWVSANYTLALTGWEQGLWSLALIYMLLFNILNVLSPMMAGRWQVSATIIKLIPLLLVGVFGTISGIISGQTVDSFTRTAGSLATQGGGLALATVSTAFAYEGWIIATSINSEIRDARRVLPRALITGTLAIMLIYMLYYLGLSGVLSNEAILQAGDKAPVLVVSKIFGSVGGSLLTAFVVVSCLGTLNGLVMATSRGMYSIAVRGRGPAVDFFSRINKKTASTLNSALAGLGISLFWLLVWYGNFQGWWGGFLDISELPIVFLYSIYLSLYFWYVRHFKDFSFVQRYVAPALAGIGSVYILIGGLRKDMVIQFLILSCLIFGAALLLDRKKK